MNEEFENEMVENVENEENVEVNETPKNESKKGSFGLIAIGAAIGVGATLIVKHIKRAKGESEEKYKRRLEKKGYIVYKPDDEENASENESEK